MASSKAEGGLENCTTIVTGVKELLGLKSGDSVPA
jgi:hypothetical protein